jgi:hypothetical protein
MADDEEMEIIEAGKHDDASFLLELHQSIKRHAFGQRVEGSVSLPRYSYVIDWRRLSVDLSLS